MPIFRRFCLIVFVCSLHNIIHTVNMFGHVLQNSWHTERPFEGHPNLTAEAIVLSVLLHF